MTPKPNRVSGCPIPCATCPFLAANQGQRHPSGWYSKKNLHRLWNGLRRGDAPGMICHSSDSKNREYGGDKIIAAGKQRECIGANTLIQRELTALGEATSFAAYRIARPRGLTRIGAMEWVGRILFAGTALGVKSPVGDVNDTSIQIPGEIA